MKIENAMKSWPKADRKTVEKYIGKKGGKTLYKKLVRLCEKRLINLETVNAIISVCE